MDNSWPAEWTFCPIGRGPIVNGQRTATFEEGVRFLSGPLGSSSRCQIAKACRAVHNDAKMWLKRRRFDVEIIEDAKEIGQRIGQNHGSWWT